MNKAVEPPLNTREIKAMEDKLGTYGGPKQEFYHVYCKFTVIRKTVREMPNGAAWIEHCRCARKCIVTMEWRVVKGRARALFRREWYERDGKYWKTTGELADEDECATNQPESNSQTGESKPSV